MSILINTHVPKEILFQIFKYLTAEDKKAAALVCKRFQLIAEDPNLLIDDFKKHQNLTFRQLSILFSSNDDITVSSDAIARSLWEKKIHATKLPTISENNLKAFLKFFQPPSYYEEISAICVLESWYRKSKDYSIEKAINIFYQFLKNINYDLDQINSITPLETAASFNSVVLIKTLIKFGANVHGPKYPDALHECDYYPTPMSYILTKNLDTTEKEQVECVIALLEAGVSPNVRNSQFLWEAINNNKEEIVKTLVKYDVNLNASRKPRNDEDEWGSALHIAVNKRNLSMVTTLIQLGADPRIENQFNKTPSQYAEQLGLKEIADFLNSQK